MKHNAKGTEDERSMMNGCPRKTTINDDIQHHLKPSAIIQVVFTMVLFLFIKCGTCTQDRYGRLAFDSKRELAAAKKAPRVLHTQVPTWYMALIHRHYYHSNIAWETRFTRPSNNQQNKVITQDIVILGT